MAALMCDYRTYRQDGMYEIATSLRTAKFVQGDMDDRDRIREALEVSEHSRDDLAATLRCSVPSLGRLLRKQRELKASERDAAFSFLGLSKRYRMIPVIGQVAAGNWREAILEPLEWDFTTRGGENTFALDVAGDSMDRAIKPGLRVVVDPDNRNLEDRGVYVVAERNAGVTLKRFRNDPARLVPDSNNSEHKEILIGTDSFELIGRAIQMIGDPSLS